MAKNGGSYRAKDIEVLEGLEPVRRRPGMYIGGTEQAGLHHLVHEILDNAVDEAMNGYADRIEVTLHKDSQTVTIEDNGRGIPVDKHPKYKKPALEIILTTLHAGGKFNERNYASAGGLHGVGASVVNALSEDFSVLVRRDGYEWTQSFKKGKPLAALKKGKKTKQSGTSVTFRADAEIFRSTSFQSALIVKSIEEKAFLNKGLLLTYCDQQQDTTQEFHYPDGLRSYVKKILGEQKEKPVGDEIFDLESQNGINIQLSFCWTEATSESMLAYVNGIHTRDGGTHVDGFRSGIAKAVRNYIQTHNLLPRGVKLTSDDIREGLLTVLSVNIPGAVAQLQFQGQTKDRLNNPEILPAVESVARNFENALNTNPSTAGNLIERIILAAKARAAARAASAGVSRKVGAHRRLNLPGKLADCSTNRPDRSEIFIVEGDSAGGTAKQGRDRETQAILPLRGKVLNTFSSQASKVKDNKEITDIITALGCGTGEHMNLSKLRYGKVVILTDADADGMHIGSLLMAFFYRYMKPLIEAGHLYLALPPLYRIRSGSGKAEKTDWVFSEEEKERTLAKIKSKAQTHITRFKGLGEMNPSTLWETTLNPKTRKLLQITIEDDHEANRMLESLLGKDAQSRYELIQENAHRLELDL